jgi:hypothetical protein
VQAIEEGAHGEEEEETRIVSCLDLNQGLFVADAGFLSECGCVASPSKMLLPALDLITANDGSTTGSSIWPAARVLACYLHTVYANKNRTFTVCELGSGTGFTACVPRFSHSSVITFVHSISSSIPSPIFNTSHIICRVYQLSPQNKFEKIMPRLDELACSRYRYKTGH